MVPLLDGAGGDCDISLDFLRFVLLFLFLFLPGATDFFCELDCSRWISVSDDVALEAVDFQPFFLPIEVDLDLLAAE